MWVEDVDIGLPGPEDKLLPHLVLQLLYPSSTTTTSVIIVINIIIINDTYWTCHILGEY